MTGPGMQRGKRKAQKVPAANIMAERAALAGFTTVDAFASSRQGSGAHQPSSTKEKAQEVQGGTGLVDLSQDDAPDEEDFGWFYEDQSLEVQGPYGLDKLRSWYTQGYLKDVTRIRPW